MTCWSDSQSGHGHDHRQHHAHLIAFSVPLLIGNIFQQLYNTVDSVVVGNFVGKQALAAVGSVAPIINMLIGFSRALQPARAF